ncbi:MAG: hypothetical protein IK131_12140 [Paludibacteraceae bacterium]|nr:hypothetical protein [Paludibacteraceae bacterium]
MRYWLSFLPILICCSCSPKEEAQTNSVEESDTLAVVVDSVCGSGSQVEGKTPNRYEETSMFFERIALQDKCVEDSFSFSLYDKDGILIRELKYLGTVKCCQTEYDVILENNRFGYMEESLHGNQRLTIYRDGERLGKYYGGMYREFNFKVIDCGIEVLGKYTDTISLAEGIPKEVFVRDHMDADGHFLGDFLGFR